MKSYSMKLVISVFLFFCSLGVSAQKPDIRKTWIGKDLEYVKIDSQSVYFQTLEGLPDSKKYILNGDTLRLYQRYTTSRDNFSKQHTRYYSFLINELTDTSLVLTALDSNALEITGRKQRTEYRERSLLKVADFKFEMIKFDATECHGTCPSLALQIDNKKKMLFIGGHYAVKQGFYTADIADSLMQELTDILALSEVDKWKIWLQIVHDAPEYIIEVHYNGKIKYIKNFFLPGVTNELVLFLLNVSKKVNLVEVKQPFQITFSQ